MLEHLIAIQNLLLTRQKANQIHSFFIENLKDKDFDFSFKVVYKSESNSTKIFQIAITKYNLKFFASQIDSQLKAFEAYNE